MEQNYVTVTNRILFFFFYIVAQHSTGRSNSAVIGTSCKEVVKLNYFSTEISDFFRVAP